MTPTEDANQQHTSECVAIDNTTTDRLELPAEMDDTTAADDSADRRPHERPMAIQLTGERDRSSSEERSMGDNQKDNEKNAKGSTGGRDTEEFSWKVTAIGEPTDAFQSIPPVDDDGEGESKAEVTSPMGTVEVDDAGIVDDHDNQGQSMSSTRKSKLDEANSPSPVNAPEGEEKGNGSDKNKDVGRYQATHVKLSQITPPTASVTSNPNDATNEENQLQETPVPFWRDESSRASTSEDGPTTRLTTQQPPVVINPHAYHLFGSNSFSASQRTRYERVRASQLFQNLDTENAGENQNNAGGASNDNDDGSGNAPRNDDAGENNNDGRFAFCQENRLLLIIGACVVCNGDPPWHLFGFLGKRETC